MTKFTSEIKLAVIQKFNPKLVSQKEYSRQMKVTRAQFQYWLKLYELRGETGFEKNYTNYPVSFTRRTKLHGSIWGVINGYRSSL